MNIDFSIHRRFAFHNDSFNVLSSKLLRIFSAVFHSTFFSREYHSILFVSLFVSVLIFPRSQLASFDPKFLTITHASGGTAVSDRTWIALMAVS